MSARLTFDIVLDRPELAAAVAPDRTARTARARALKSLAHICGQRRSVVDRAQVQPRDEADGPRDAANLSHRPRRQEILPAHFGGIERQPLVPSGFQER